jgi:hypothetical protein
VRSRASGVLDLAEKAGGNVIDKTTNGDTLRNPRMGANLLQLAPDILFNVLEAVEVGGSSSSGSRVILDSSTQILFACVHQSAIGMIGG